jgi:hypothetical protein
MRRRSHLRFTLRTLLLAITALCIWLGIHTQRASRQKAIVEEIQKNVGSVTYDFEYDPKGRAARGESWVPRWLRDRLGIDFFHNVKQVHTRERTLLPKVASFSSLEELTIWDHELTDTDLEPLRGHRRLKILRLASDQHTTLSGDYPDTTLIGDPGLQLIGELPALEEAAIDGYHITGKGLVELAKSRSLRSIYVEQCDAAVEPSATEPLRSLKTVERLWIRKWVQHQGDVDLARRGKW